MYCSTPGLPVHHQLPEFTQTHVHQDGDAIQPSQPLSSPSPPTPNPSQNQGLFQWVNSSYEVAKVLEFQLKHQSFQRTFNRTWIFRKHSLFAVTISILKVLRTCGTPWTYLPCYLEAFSNTIFPYSTETAVALQRLTVSKINCQCVMQVWH